MSLPIFWLSLAFLGGIALGRLLHWPPAAWLALAAFSLVLLPVQSRYRSKLPSLASVLRLPFPSILLLALLALGAARYAYSLPDLGEGSVAWYNDREGSTLVEGVLAAPPEIRDTRVHLRVDVDGLLPAGEADYRPVEGRLLAVLPPGGDWRYEDRVRLQGMLTTPPEEELFSYREYLEREGIYSLLQPAEGERLMRRKGFSALAAIYALNDYARHTVYRLFPDPEASLLVGILLGDENGIPPGVQEAFQATGAAHVVAISGFNMTIIAGLFMALFGRMLGKRRGTVAAAAGIAAYTLLVGAGPAVVRAALMSGLSLFARQLGRRQHGLNSLALVAAGMAFYNPHVLQDIGFQMSFMATLGLILYAEPFSAAFVRLAARRLPAERAQKLAGPVGEYFLFTLAAQLTVLPVTIYHFQRLSLSSLLVNPLILPVQPAVMFLGGAALLAGLISPALGRIVAGLAWAPLAYTIRMVEWFADLPGGSLTLGRTALPVVLAFYALLFAWTFARPAMENLVQRLFNGPAADPNAPHPAASGLPAFAPPLLLGSLAVLTAFVWQAVLARPDGRLRLTVLPVSTGTRSGDALLVRTTEGRNLLIGGGPSPTRLSDGLGRRLPLGQRRLDWLVVAEPDDNQVAGLPYTLERFPPNEVLWAGPQRAGAEARRLQAGLIEARIPVTIARTGQTLDLGQGARLRVLAVGEQGAALLLEWGNFQALLPFGLDAATLETLQNDRSLGEVDALLLVEPGAGELYPPEWIAALRPQVVLLSTAPQDRRAEGIPEALQGYSVLRTDRNGWIQITTDGERMWVEVERQ